MNSEIKIAADNGPLLTILAERLIGRRTAEVVNHNEYREHGLRFNLLRGLWPTVVDWDFDIKFPGA